MLSLLHLEWLLLIVLAACFFIVGCTTLSPRPSVGTATAMPVRLTPLPFEPATLVPRSTLPPSATQNTTIARGLLLNASPPPLPDITIGSPTCFISPNQGYLCMGQITNHRDEKISNMTLTLNTETMTTSPFALAQRLILPQDSAPYHLIVDTMPDALTALHFDAQLINNERLLHPVTVSAQEAYHTDNGRYGIMMTLQNETDSTLTDIRVIGTLTDDMARVVGYRVIQLESSLLRDEQTTLRLEIVPQVQSDELNHTIFAEAVALQPAD